VLDTSREHLDHGVELPLTTRTTHSGTSVVVTVTGELDLATAPSFQRDVLALFALPVLSVVLDFGGLTFMDSSGLKVLTRIRASAEDHGVKLTLRRVPDQARRIFEITLMTGMFRIE
jgi:anti-anti-sigma factor